MIKNASAVRVNPDSHPSGILIHVATERLFSSLESAAGLYRALARMARRTEPTYAGLVATARQSPVNGVDETGWKVGGRLQWMDVAASAQVTFNFYSGELPDFVCTEFNDSFVAWLTSSAWKGKGGDFNISFDSQSNPINVNNGFFQVCSPAGTQCSNMKTAATCSLGENQLLGTGFDVKQDYCGTGNSNTTGGGATGWLTTTAPVAPGETITLQFMVWNTGDTAYDSSVLLDNWQWQATDQSVTTTRPPN